MHVVRLAANARAIRLASVRTDVLLRGEIVFALEDEWLSVGATGPATHALDKRRLSSFRYYRIAQLA